MEKFNEIIEEFAQKDEEGNYTVPVKAMICSCGISTPKGGVYKTSRGYEWGSLIGGVYGQYATRIVDHILFHSVPYYSINKGDLEWEEYNKLGTSASLGCIRLAVSDSKWLYDNLPWHTQVEIYESICEKSNLKNIIRDDKNYPPEMLNILKKLPYDENLRITFLERLTVFQ